MDILHREEFKVKIPNMQEAKDPDDFIKAKGRSAFIKNHEGSSSLCGLQDR
jgi:DNA primase